MLSPDAIAVLQASQPKTRMSTGDDEFKAGDAAAIDLGMFDSVSTSRGGSELNRQSLYLKFDPLASMTPKAAGPVSRFAPKAAGVAAAPPPAADSLSSGKLLDFATPEHAKKRPSNPSLAGSNLSAALSALSMDENTSTSTSTSSNSNSQKEKEKDEQSTPMPKSFSGRSVEAAGGFAPPPAAAVPSQSLNAALAAASDSTKEPETPRGGFRYTEADVRRRVDEAVRQAQEEAAILQMEIEDIRAQLKQEQADNEQMRGVVDEYEKAMAKLIAKTENQDTNGRISALEQEKAQLEIDLQKTETAFADLHHKYEKTKEIVTNLKKNEASLKGTLEQAQVALKQSEDRYAALKEHAEKKIMTANEEIAAVREQFKNQMQVMTVKLKKAEADVSQLTRNLESKEKDNQELTSICDDLVKQLEARSS